MPMLFKPASRPSFLMRLIATAAVSLMAGGARPGSAAEDPGFRVAVFSADITVPVGHGMMGGAWLSRSVADPLEAHGLVLLGGDAPVVFVALDWCEVRNAALERWQTVLAQAAGTKRDHVMVCAVHQHDAPVADLEAEQILRDDGVEGTVCDPRFHEVAVQRTAEALRTALAASCPVTHWGVGSAEVTGIASNRRYMHPDGRVRFDRTSSTRDPVVQAAPENLIDPWLRTLSFWNGDAPLVAVSGYAVHPMSYYGQGEVSADFPGIARRRRQEETPGVKQIYFTGCAGNVTAGKYNDGARTNRLELARRLHAAMVEAWRTTRRFPLTNVTLRVESVRLEARDEPGFGVVDLEARVVSGGTPFQRCLAAMGLAWRRRVDAGHRVEIPCLDLGRAQWLVLPGEAYVEFQLAAQRMRPDCFVLVSGYGEGATGYIPTERHFAERDGNLTDWCWVAPGSEGRLLEGIRRALRVSEPASGLAPWLTNMPAAWVKKERYLPNPAPRVAPWATQQYVGEAGQMREVQGVERESDVGEEIRARWSEDHGKTWSDFVPVQPSNRVNYGGVAVWEGESVSVFDPRSRRLVQLWLRQIEVGGVFHNFTYTRTSTDLGRTWSAPRQLRYEAGGSFDAGDPLNAGFLNHNEGYPGNSILVRGNGDLFVCLAHANAPGDPKNNERPWRMGSVCFTGSWDKAPEEYVWTSGARLEVSPEVSARGLMEPDATELRDGRLLVVWRASTHGWDGTVASSPGRKLFSLSADGGRTFGPVAEWRYADGGAFYSPSSFHRFIRHSGTGRLYWLGNLSVTPPVGNSPRYPLVMAEVDEAAAALKRETVTAIDDRQPGDGEIQFSNFSLVEHRETHDLVLQLTTYGQTPEPQDWATADCYRYTLTPTRP